MIIKSLHITDFSGTKSRDIEFAPGFNVIEGPNESGKTTVANFIKFMFYGLADKAERTRCFSWGSASASGSMVVEANGGVYRIERECTGAGRDKIQIVDTATGAPCFEGRDPDEVFLGVPRELFAHTAFIGQASGGEIDGEKVSRAIENILFTGDETTNADKAKKKLDDARVVLYHKSRKGGRIYDLLGERDDLTRRLETAKQSNLRVIERESGVRETRELLEKNGKKLAEATEALDRVNRAARVRGISRLRELSEKADAVRREYAEICAADSYEGFLPDAEYVSDLERAERERERVGAAMAEAQADYENYSLRAGDLESVTAFSEKLRAMGGADELRETMNKYRKRQGRARGFAIFFFIFAVIAAALAAVAFFVQLPAPLDFMKGDLLCAAIFGAAALVLLAGGITSVIVRSHAKIEQNELICEFDADSEADLEKRLQDLNYDETRMRLHNARVAEYEERMSSLKKQKSAADALVGELLHRWGRDGVGEAASAASESLKKRSELEAEIEKFDLARDTLAAQLGITDLPAALAEAGDVSEAEEITPEREERLRTEYDFYNDENKALTERLYAYEKELAVLEATVESAGELADRLHALDGQIDDLSKKHRALVMAHDTLGEAANDLRESVSPRLAESAGRLLSSLTGGKYDRLGVGRALELAYDADHQTHGIEYMSAGTGDVAYLSLRFALIELLYEGVKPPLVFDESFSRLDDGRYRNVLELIRTMSERGVQTLLFTSQTRDSRIAEEIGGCTKIRFNEK